MPAPSASPVLLRFPKQKCPRQIAGFWRTRLSGRTDIECTHSTGAPLHDEVSERAFLSAQPRWQRVRNKARLGAGSELRTHSNREVWQATTTKNVDSGDGVDRSACRQHQSRRKWQA